MNGMSMFEQRIDQTNIPPIISIEGCYGSIEPLDG